MSDYDLDELSIELDDFRAPQQEKTSHTPREERIIAGFEDIERFFEKHGYPPAHGEGKEIFERLYAVRLDRMRNSDECRSLLANLDKYGLLQKAFVSQDDALADLDDDTLLAELGAVHSSDGDVTKLTHVRTRAEIRAAEDIANRIPCRDFDKFKPLFDAVAKDISNGSRLIRQIRKDAGFLKSQIKVGDFFILYGQTVYVAEIGEPIKGSNETMDARLRVIYSNGTESNLLLDSLRRGFYKDESSRIVSEPSAGPLFSGKMEDCDISSGTIYVLRSKSNHPLIQKNRDVIHKIGVTGGDIKKRIVAAKTDPTFLMDDVDIVATYELSNIDRTKLENLIHRFFDPVRMDIEVTDRFGKPVIPREWFLVPLFIIDEAIKRIRDGSIVNCVYNPEAGQIIELTK